MNLDTPIKSGYDKNFLPVITRLDRVIHAFAGLGTKMDTPIKSGYDKK
ncbi:MAG: hypothetical protein ACLFNV_12745 [Desulfovibrionales bacterium]